VCEHNEKIKLKKTLNLEWNKDFVFEKHYIQHSKIKGWKHRFPQFAISIENFKLLRTNWVVGSSWVGCKPWECVWIVRIIVFLVFYIIFCNLQMSLNKPQHILKFQWHLPSFSYYCEMMCLLSSSSSTTIINSICAMLIHNGEIKYIL
jgi:Flp pilus assembly protein TadB